MSDESNVGGSGSPLKAMVSFFTIWQQDITQDDMDAMERRFHLVPVVGVLFALAIIVEVAVLMLLWKDLGFGSGAIVAALVMATVYIGSRFIHFDGLTDFGDGTVVSGTREDHVRALKDTLVGAGGVGTAIVVTLISFALYSYAGFTLLVVGALAEIMVKNAMVSAAAFGTPGNGMAGRQVALTTTRSAAISCVISLVLGLIIGAVALAVYNGILGTNLLRDYGTVAICVIVAVVVSFLVGYLMARKSNSVFGMVNGDILGATNEISRPAVMFVMLLVLVW